jgi:hypothetical protein
MLTRFSLGVCVVLGVSCQGVIGGPLQAEILVVLPGEPITPRLQVVELASVVDLNVGTGVLFDVVGGVELRNDELEDVVRAVDYADMTTRLRADLKSVRPSFHQENDVYVADDYQTLEYLTIWYNFERAFSFVKSIGDVSDASQTKSFVSLHGDSYDGILEYQSSDNAAYIPTKDGWVTYQPVVQAGIPFGMSETIAAHEFGHRFFFHNVFGAQRFDLWRADFASTTTGSRLLSAFNEGLADIFAFAALGDADAQRAVLATADATDPNDPPLVENPIAGVAERRGLESRFAKDATYDNLAELTLDSGLLKDCDFTVENFRGEYDIYCVGTVLAKAIFEGSSNDETILRAEVMPALPQALSEVGASIAVEGDFAPWMMLQAIAAELPPARRDVMCRAFTVRFASIIAAGSVPACL